MVGADLGMLSSSAQYWPLLPHHRQMSEGPSPDRSAVQSKLRGRGANCCQLSWIFKLCGKSHENIVSKKSLFWALPIKKDSKEKLIEICRIGMILLYWFIRFLVVVMLLKEMSEVPPPAGCVKDGWTVANRVHLKLSCLGKYIHVYFFSLYNKLTFKFDYECMRIGLGVSCQIFSSWYIFSLAPSTLVDHQLTWIKLIISIKGSLKCWSPSPRSGRGPSCPSCRARCCPPRRDTPQQSWLQLRKIILQSSDIYVCGSLFSLIFYWRYKILCWIFDGICYLHAGQGYSSHTISSYNENIFPLTLDLGELDKYGRAEVPVLVTIREVIFWYSVGGMIYDWSQILPVCRVLSLTIYPDSLILQTKEFTTQS